MTTIAVIPARGGSKGVPRKNVLPLAGKPLIQYSIEQALAASSIDAVYVSTDDAEIASVSEAAGAAGDFAPPPTTPSPRRAPHRRPDPPFDRGGAASARFPSAAGG